MVAREKPKARGEQEERPQRGPSISDFEDNLRFNRHALDDALMEQPDLFYRVSREYAQSISRRDGLKLELEQAMAEMDKQIRRKADEADEKITEKAILSEIELAPRIIDAKKEMADATYMAARWGALKESYIQRSYAIKDMCGLYASNYFADHAGSGARNAAVDGAADRNRRDAGEAREKR